ncbi:TPA_asm: hypothetical protein GZX72_14200, partial [Listeria monocytogenes]|nr:hypothetical protein [Listeria monocytogenes]
MIKSPIDEVEVIKDTVIANLEFGVSNSIIARQHRYLNEANSKVIEQLLQSLNKSSEERKILMHHYNYKSNNENYKIKLE